VYKAKRIAVMKFLYYVKYWLFIGVNWNFRLAFFSIYHEIRGEKKYHLDTIEIDRLKSISIKSENLKHASIYQACNYYILEKGLNYLSGINENHNFTDFGCGKGRALVVAAHYGFNKITGIDFAKALCVSAQQNIQFTRTLYPAVNFEIICQDAAIHKISKDDNVFFFFNPFDEVVMLKVVKNILASIKEQQRIIYIMYINPVHKEIFLSAGFDEEYYFRRLHYLELSILSKHPDEYNEID
jgi:SAM-dependent methyltransferase